MFVININKKFICIYSDGRLENYMKYKILVSGKSAHVNDFIKHTSENFFSISTSSYIKDTLNHFKVLEPDAYIIFLDTTEGEIIATIQGLKDYPSYNNAPIIIVGTEEVCKSLNRSHPYIHYRSPCSKKYVKTGWR